jgi:hypothetical protein
MDGVALDVVVLVDVVDVDVLDVVVVGGGAGGNSSTIAGMTCRAMLFCPSGVGCSGARTDAVAADPHAEKALVATATTESLPALRDQCRRIKAAAREDEIAHHDEIRRARFLRTWTDGEGAGRGEWRLPPEDHARIVAGVTAELKAVVAMAKAAGTPAGSAEAHAADALVRMAEANAGPDGTEAVIHLRVDQSAFERGTTVPGEICEIEGVGPVPIATARNLSTRAVVHALVVHGTDVTRYAKLGRSIPTALARALEERDPVCVEPGCNVHDDLETHHKMPVADGGVTSLENLERRCRWHHYLATHHPDRAPPEGLRLAG